MAGRIKAAINKAIPWLLFGSVLIPAGLSAAVGVLVLVFWRAGGDIALGVLAITLGLAVLTGTIISLALLSRQNRMVRAQAELVAHVGHELRTPLAAVLMGVETLKSGRLTDDEERLAFLDMIQREAKRLAGLVDKAIGYQEAAGRNKAGHRAKPGRSGTGGNRRIEPDTDDAEADVAAPAGRLVGEALAPWLTRSDTAAAVRYRDCCSESDLLAVDRYDLAGALSNLVSNALTHGRASGDDPVEILVEPAGGPVTNVEHGRRGRDGWIAIVVSDHGPGVPKTDRKRIFERFQRGRETGGNEIPGLGLGLSIVREFAQNAGGHVELAETPGGGTTFRLTLPRADVPAGGHSDG